MRKLRLAAEALFGSVVAGVVDTAGLTFETVKVEAGSISRTIDPARSTAKRQTCGPYSGVAGFASSARVIRQPGSIDFERALTVPDGGGANLPNMIDWMILRSRLGDGGAPASVTDVVVAGSTATVLKVGAAGEWKPGDCGYIGERPFIVSDINADSDLVLLHALDAAPAAAATIRRTRCLYYLNGVEGSSIAYEDHGEGQLWRATGVRISGFDIRPGADGRALFAYKNTVAVWTEDHDNADPDCSGDDCADDDGTPLAFDAVQPIFTTDYQGKNALGVAGGLTAAPHASASTEIDVMDIKITVDLPTEPRKSLGSNIGICTIKGNKANVTVELPPCEDVDLFDNDNTTPVPRRHAIIPLSPFGAGIGGAIFLGGLQLDALAKDKTPGEIVDDQNLKFGMDAFCGIKAVATNGTAARAGYNASFKIYFIV